MKLSVHICDGPNGRQLANWSVRSKDLTFSTDDNGYKACSFFVALRREEAWRWYERSGVMHLDIRWGAKRVWSGRVEDIAIVAGGLRIGAFGYFRAFSDIPYTALWSTTKIKDWRVIQLGDDSTGFRGPFSDRFNFNNKTGLHIGLSKNAIYGNLPFIVGTYIYRIEPNGSSKTIVGTTFNYTIAYPAANWVAQLVAWTSDPITTGTSTVLWSFTSAGAGGVSGSVNITFTGTTLLTFEFLYNGAPAVYVGESGDNFLEITDLRLRTTTASTVTADAVASDIVAKVAATNASQISPSTAFISSPGLDLKDEAYADANMADVMIRLAALGDSATPPNRYEVGVYDDQALFFRQRGSGGRWWLVDVDEAEIERTIEMLRNNVYVTMKALDGREIRISAENDTFSIGRYGLTRTAALRMDTSYLPQAAIHRSAHLNDLKTPIPRAGITVKRVFTPYNTRVPNFFPRAGDKMTIRNLPPNLGQEIDRIRTFYVAGTSYKAKGRQLSVTPEAPIPTLTNIIAREGRGFVLYT